MLEIKNLTYSRNKQEILHHISVSFPDHKMTAVVGPNGCGKTTLLSHLSRLIPSRNTVWLDGTAIEEIPRRRYARQVAVLSQQHETSVSDFLVRDMVLMGRYPYKEPFKDYTVKDRQSARAAMEKTGVTPLSGKRMSTLSGGEKQRVLIAKAFAQKSEYLLLDEPTNHLDIKHKVELMEELKKFHGTVIIVLHDLSLAVRYCDYALVMKQGTTAAEGETQQTLTPSLLQDIFEVPFHIAVSGNNHFLYY